MSQLKIHEMPQEERPREKLAAHGASALSNPELIAILLRTGVVGKNAIEVARELLEKYGSRFYLIGSDYIYPRESNRIMRELLRQRRGQVVGEHYLDLGARPSEFRLLMRDVRNARHGLSAAARRHSFSLAPTLR